MSDKRFRFGVIGVPRPEGGLSAWQATARRAEELGFGSLLVPDNTQLPSAFPTLALAAAATRRLHVGTFVLATPLRAPRLLAWEAYSLSQLTAGRFELGVGTGTPDVVRRQAVELYGGTPLPGAERLERVGQAIDRYRELEGRGEGEQRSFVLVAAGGVRALGLAGEKADGVALAAGPLATRDDVRGLVARLREAAGSRFDDIELTTSVYLDGADVPPEAQRYLGVDLDALRRSGALALLPASTDAVIAELQRRREDLGISRFVVQAALMEALAPVVERLAGT